jgi:hypothetical protein
VPIRFTWDGRSPSVPPAKARAWWFDLREDDHRQPEHLARHKPKPSEGRRVLSRSPDEVVVEDVWKGPPFRSTVRLEGKDALRIASQGQGFGSQAAYRFVPDGKGTRIHAETEVQVQGLFGLLAGLMKGRFERQHREDMGFHLAHMEREWAERPW